MSRKIICVLCCVSIMAQLLFGMMGVSAYKSNSANIALGKPTFHSSIYEGMEQYGSFHLVDGDVWSEYYTHVSSTPEWAVIDLEKPYRVEKIRVAGRMAIVDELGRKLFSLQLSNDPNFATFETVHHQGAEAFPHREWLEVTVTAKTHYRYVRYIGDGVGCRGLNEIEVYGTDEQEDPYLAYEEEAYLKALKAVNQLGIMEVTTFSPNGVVTRGEALEILLAFGGYGKADLKTAMEPIFADVPKEHPYFSEVQMAYSLGWLSLPEDRLFQPENYITKNAFLKMLLCDMNYADVIGYMGGYPIGVLSLANENRLLKGVTSEGDAVLTCTDIVYILYNALGAPYLLQSSFSDHKVEYEEVATLGEYRFNMVEKTGVITANSFTDLEDGSAAGKYHVALDGVSYIDRSASAGALLGYTADCFIDTESDEIIFAVKSSDNEEITFRGEEIVSTENDLKRKKISLMDSKGKTKSIHLSDGFTVVNGFITDNSYTMDTLTGDYAYITAVDNDEDGEYDVLFVKNYESTVVKSVYTAPDGETVISAENGETYRIPDGRENYCNVSSNLGSAKLAALEGGDVISICQSADGRGTEILVMIEGNVVGTVEEYFENENEYVVIGGKTYIINKGYDKALKNGSSSAEEIEVGKSYTFKLNVFGEIVAVDRANTGFRYAFLIDKMGSLGLDPVFNLKLLMDNGKVEVHTITDKVIIDEVSYKASSLKAYEDNEFFLPQDVVLLYMEDGKIKEITTKMGDLKKTEYVGDVRFSYHFNAIFIGGNYTMEARFAENTPVFEIPVYYEVEGDVQREIIDTSNDKNFSVTTVRATVDGHNEEVTDITAAYDVDENTKQAEAFVRKVEVGTGSTMANISPMMVVDRVTQAVNEEGEVVEKAYGFTVSGMTEIVFDEGLVASVMGDKSIERGDIIKYRMNSASGIVDVFEHHFDASEDKGKMGTKGDDFWIQIGNIGSIAAGMRGHYGVIVSKEKNLLSVSDVMPDGTNDAAVFRRMDVHDLDNYKVYIYDEKSDTLYAETADALGSFVCDTNKNARVMAINDRNGGNRMIVAYQFSSLD